MRLSVQDGVDGSEAPTSQAGMHDRRQVGMAICDARTAQCGPPAPPVHALGWYPSAVRQRSLLRLFFVTFPLNMSCNVECEIVVDCRRWVTAHNDARRAATRVCR